MSARDSGFPGRNHLIPLPEAVALTARYRASGSGPVKAHLFDRSAFDAILGQAGCAGLRIYHARKPGGEETLVVVGTDAKGNDLLAPGEDATSLVAEEALPCPPLCSLASPLTG